MPEPRLQRTNTDPWLVHRMRDATLIAQHELAVRDAVRAALAVTFAELYRLVLDIAPPKDLAYSLPSLVAASTPAARKRLAAMAPPHLADHLGITPAEMSRNSREIRALTAAGEPQPGRMEAARQTWVEALTAFLRPVLERVYRARWAQVLDRAIRAESDQQLAVLARLATKVNRLVEPYWREQLARISSSIDEVFDAIRAQLVTAQSLGESVQQMRARVAAVLQVDTYANSLLDRVQDIEHRLFNNQLTVDTRRELFRQRSDALVELFGLEGRRARSLGNMRLAEAYEQMARDVEDRDAIRARRLRRQAVELRREAARLNPDTSRIDRLKARVAGIDDRLFRNPDLSRDEYTRLAGERRELLEEKQRDEHTWGYKAVRIARTEVIGTLNAGTLEAAQATEDETGEELRKKWLHTPDERCRPTHEFAGRYHRAIPLGQPFTVGGWPLQRPCDEDGPPQETINCRCSLLILSVAEADSWNASIPPPPQQLEAAVPGGDNWIEQTGTGHLPPYLRRIANALMRSGHSESNAIQIAWGTVRRWCRGGGDVKPDTRAKACAAVAEMEAKQAEANATAALVASPDTPDTAAALAADTAATEYNLSPDLPEPELEALLDQMADDMPELPNGWRGPLAPLDQRAEDNGFARRILEAPQDGQIRFRTWPMPFRWQEQDTGGHDGAVVTGRIDRAWIQDGAVWGEGPYDLEGVHGREAARLLAGGFANRVSVDITDAITTVRFETRGGDLIPEPDSEETAHALNTAIDSGEALAVEVVKDWKLGAVTQVAISAFDGAAIEPVYGYVPAGALDDPDEPDEDDPDEDDGDGPTVSQVQAAARKVGAKVEFEIEHVAEHVAAIAAAGDTTFDTVRMLPAGGFASNKPWDGDASRFDDDQYERAAAACDPASKGTVKQRCFLPHHEPDGTVNVAGVHAAAARLSQLEDRSPDAVAKAKAHLRAHYADLDEEAPESLTAAVDADYMGGMIALSPSESDAQAISAAEADGGDPTDQLHVTLAFLGDDVSVFGEGARAALDTATAAAAQHLPVTVRVAGYGVLGDAEPPATVLFLNGEGLAEAHGAVMAELNDYGSEEFPAQHAPWIPHLTLGYGMDPAVAASYVGLEFTLDTADLHLGTEVEQIPASGRLALVAAAGHVFAATDFANPRLSEPTPLQIGPDGRVFGHLAAWGVCHLGVGNACIMAPRSATGYRYFHLGIVDTDGGPLEVGKITLGGGHAGPRDGVRAATEHYDDSGSAAAVVRAGEDAHGIWLSGRLLPDVSAAQVTRLQISPLSGDWRQVGGNLELVAALAVNTPGFPVPRAANVGERQVSLVAAGIVHRPPAPAGQPAPDVEDVDALLDRLAARMEERQRERAEREAHAMALAARIGRTPQDKALQLASRMEAALGRPVDTITDPAGRV